ncbi:MAG: NAD(+)/NADH kinase [Bacteroidales bacterium]|nr:NAD(+)/NADH kinase [Bacteroidales bacterium]
MKIAVYSKPTTDDGKKFIVEVVRFLCGEGVTISAFHLLKELLPAASEETLASTFSSQQELSTFCPDFVFSIGGDGTFIDAANLVGDSGVPILGINTGRIGFLTNVNRNNFREAFDFLKKSDYQIEKRILLQIKSDHGEPLPASFALNDISIHPHGESINAVKVQANGEHLNTYWGDGLIVATPTGSTAYSLSCGGPILVPSANVMVLTPIASHSLTVRPIVLPVDNELRIKVESRSHRFVLSVDSHRLAMNDEVTLTVSRAPYTIQTIRLPNAGFYSVIREKLLWGLDKRNFNHHE